MSDDKTEQPKRRRDVIQIWREANLAELDRNLSTWKAIRDDFEASDKDRIEAAKAIARQMGALSPDQKKTEKEERRDEGPVKPKLKDEHSAELEALLATL